MKRNKTALWYCLSISQLVTRIFVSQRSLHAVEIACVQICALRIIHPCALAIVFRCLRKCSDPFIEICSDLGHLLIELGSLGRQTPHYILVDTKDSLVDS